MKGCKKVVPRHNTIARDLRTPKYRPRVPVIRTKQAARLACRNKKLNKPPEYFKRPYTGIYMSLV